VSHDDANSPKKTIFALSDGGLHVRSTRLRIDDGGTSKLMIYHGEHGRNKE
jgi:hypothetical protein